MGEIPRDIPEREKFSTSLERSEFSSAVNFDPTVETAIEHMTAHADALDQETTSPLDSVLDEYGETLKLLDGDLDPATRTRLEAQRDELRSKVRTADEYDQVVERELAGAVEREEKLHDRADILMAKHPLGEKNEPVDPTTPAAEALRECIRVKLLAENLFLKTQDATAELPKEQQPNVLVRLDGLKIKLLRATEELSTSKLDTRFPENVAMEIWQSSLTKLQDSLESIILINRAVDEQVKNLGQRKNQAPPGSIQARPS